MPFQNTSPRACKQFSAPGKILLYKKYESAVAIDDFEVFLALQRGRVY
jgi:hypothetical protein